MLGKPAQHASTSADKLSLLLDVSAARYLAGLFDGSALMSRIIGEAFALSGARSL